ncbi:hypothetical protein [uncultured Microbacterium sp.]|uniref:hypothetical protein n=1 Tax=uncultured Microbacterium sp. TaxID=191216 RepID=UPI00262B8815|nr:hypothetical protein [uncultured Microbacterium sp.]
MQVETKYELDIAEQLAVIKSGGVQVEYVQHASVTACAFGDDVLVMWDGGMVIPREQFEAAVARAAGG